MADCKDCPNYTRLKDQVCALNKRLTEKCTASSTRITFLGMLFVCILIFTIGSGLTAHEQLSDHTQESTAIHAEHKTKINGVEKVLVHQNEINGKILDKLEEIQTGISSIETKIKIYHEQ